MSIILKQPITGPAAWSGPDLESETSWLRPLTPDIIDWPMNWKTAGAS